MLAELAADDDRRVTAAIGTDEPVLRRAYRSILLDSMVHELNAVRALLGEPDELRFAEVWGEPDGVAATCAFGDTECVFLWVDLPGIARYEQEWSFFTPDRRATLRLPSPFLRGGPSLLELEGGEPGTPTSWRVEHVAAYEEGFKRELVEFHASIVAEREPRTCGRDALRDVAFCQSIIQCHLERRPIPSPSDPETHAARAVH
jgi:predicted dehydrogenase